MHVLENYRTNTSTGFSNAQSLAVALKPIDETQLRTRFLSVSSKPRLFWQMNAGEPKIPYDGVPFISIGQITDLPCVRYGGRRKKSEQVTLPSGDIIPSNPPIKPKLTPATLPLNIPSAPSSPINPIKSNLAADNAP